MPSKKNVAKSIEKEIFFTFGDHTIQIPLKDLVLKKDGKKVVLNIKQTYNNHAIMGEPLFKHYFCVFDYSKNRIGMAPRR